jgi:hypothetical protein
MILVHLSYTYGLSGHENVNIATFFKTMVRTGSLILWAIYIYGSYNLFVYI